MHPVLVELATPFGIVPVYAYGVCLGLAVLVGWYLTLALAERDARDPKPIADAFLAALIGALVGARAFHLVAHPGALRSIGSALAIHAGGMVGVGGVVGGLAALVAHVRIRKGRVLAVADFLAPAMAMAHVLVRLGCYLYGCCYGGRLGSHAAPFLRALGTFPRVESHGVLVGSPAFLDQVAAATAPIDAASKIALPVHPTELYEAVLAFALFFVSIAMWKRRRFEGEAFLVTLFGYAVIRLAVEPFRGDPGRVFALGLSLTQITASAMLVYTVLTYLNVRPAAPRPPLPSHGRRTA